MENLEGLFEVKFVEDKVDHFEEGVLFEELLVILENREDDSVA